MMKAVNAQMTSLAHVFQMTKIAALRDAFAKMRGRKNYPASGKLGWLSVALDTSSWPSGESVKSALACTFTLSLGASGYSGYHLLPILGIFLTVPRHGRGGSS